MDNIAYVGEHLLPGFIGKTAVIIALLSAFSSAFLFFLGRKGDLTFYKIAKTSYYIHIAAVLTIAACLFYLLFSGYVEYDYAWKHTNKAMPFRYLFACFWEGQEGSFILWMVWLAVLGFILIRKNFELKQGVLFVVALVQFALVTMLLGVFIGELRIGSNPFLLIRELPENYNLPWTLLPDYLTRIPTFADGRGLNPLLQNYWMTIHPPILFLGFALSLIPFAFSAASLLNRNENSWLEHVKPWAYAAVTVLGCGILMGGAWAYEALSFGGFWAWDPVENASLVPWLILVAAAHMIIVARRTHKHYFSAHILSALGFFFIVYSTFLTRSGILGDTSVHSFTDNGMIGQLLFYLLLALFCSADLLSFKQVAKKRWFHRIASIVLLVLIVFQTLVLESVVFFVLLQIISFAQSAKSKTKAKEDALSSREFWMFIGAFILVLSAFQISFSTSIPVVNKFLEPFAGVFNDVYGWTKADIFKDLAKANFAPPTNAINHYNKWQAPFAILILITLTISQNLKYKGTSFGFWFKKNRAPLAVSILVFLGTLIYWDFDFLNSVWLILLFVALYTLFANLFHLIEYRKAWKGSLASSLSHIGFGLVVLGTLVSGGRKDKISANSSGIDVTKVNEEFKNDEDLLLFLGDTLYMGDFFVLYKRKFSEDINVFYEIEFYSAEQKYYSKGAKVQAGGKGYQAIDDHTAGSDFFVDIHHWKPLVEGDSSEAVIWKSAQSGEKLYSLFPRVQKNRAFGNVPEPDTKHYLDKDIFTHIKWAELEDPEVDNDGYMEASSKDVHAGDTLYTSKHIVVYRGSSQLNKPEELGLEASDIVIQANFDVFNETGIVDNLQPLYIVRDTSMVIPSGVQSDLAGLRMSIDELHGDDAGLKVSLSEHINNRREFIVFQAIVFPGVNILWLGCIVMTLGGILSVFKRSRKTSVVKE